MTVLAAAALVAGTLAGCGADPNDAPGAALETVDDGLRVVEVEMTEMAFGPASIDIASGETLRLRFHNAGLAVHEAVIGDLEFQEDHAAGMASGATHEADDAHEEGTDQIEALIVAPGDSADMVYTAEEAGALIIGCHQPGHWDAGMRSDLNVT